MNDFLDGVKDFFCDVDFSKIIDVLSFHSDSPMIFSSGLFFVLFLIFYPIYILLGNSQRIRILYVTIFSLYFYFKSSGWCVLLLLASSSSDFIIGMLMDKTDRDLRRKLLVCLSVIINLGVLSYFKYFNFFADIVWSIKNSILDGNNEAWQNVDIVLPVGISFYTFQTMSYIIDIYRREIKPVRRWVDYVFYVSFFPQLVAGPIVRAKDFIPQIYNKPFLSRNDFGRALFLITSGLLKKVVISDYISLNFVDRIFESPSHYTGLEVLMGIYGYALQIYCDFSGYSDMAIGIALVLGFQFNINFDSPYRSASITEFWRRWHISLSTWLKDYLYIPLGGNRKGKIRTYINLIITMLLGGLWHGAALRFILWGGIHGLALAVHKIWSVIVPGGKNDCDELPFTRRWIGRIITFNLVCFSWIFFRADSMETVSSMLNAMVFNFHPEIILQLISGYPVVFSLMLIGYLLHFVGKKGEERYVRILTNTPYILQVLYFVAVIFIVVQFRSSDIQPFIYFQF